MKKRNVIFLIIILLIIGGIIVFLNFFNNKSDKNFKIGNNTSSQEIVNYILNISSYEAKVQVEVNSNKNQNKYIIKQQYIEPDTEIQEVLEPSNIVGVRLTRNGEQLKIENTNLNLTSIFENYEYMGDNDLDLSCFIKDYKSDEQANWREENNQIIMTTKKEKEKSLWIDKSTGNPIKLEIKEKNEKTKVYILYNEVSINN